MRVQRELIRGGSFIGIKADVWSSAVLLYALLNGFLPFDDDHTPYLYRLIQRGEYDVPHWLSPGSIAIIARLLQTDPYRRISVKELLEHPWTMDGYRKPVHWQSKIEWNYDETYFLLLYQKLCGENPTITAPPKKLSSLAIETEAEPPPTSPLTTFTFSAQFSGIDISDPKHFR